MSPIVTVPLWTISLFSAGSPEALVRPDKRGTPTILQIFCNELPIEEVSS
jgi:hypothetical protein